MDGARDVDDGVRGRPTASSTSPTTIDRKIKALLCHASQMTNPDAMDELIRGWARPTWPSRAGLAEGHYAEAFQVIATG